MFLKFERVGSNLLHSKNNMGLRRMRSIVKICNEERTMHVLFKYDKRATSLLTFKTISTS